MGSIILFPIICRRTHQEKSKWLHHEVVKECSNHLVWIYDEFILETILKEGIDMGQYNTKNISFEVKHYCKIDQNSKHRQIQSALDTHCMLYFKKQGVQEENEYY